MTIRRTAAWCYREDPMNGAKPLRADSGALRWDLFKERAGLVTFHDVRLAGRRGGADDIGMGPATRKTASVPFNCRSSVDARYSMSLSLHRRGFLPRQEDFFGGSR